MANDCSLTPLQIISDAPVLPVIVLHELAHAVPRRCGQNRRRGRPLCRQPGYTSALGQACRDCGLPLLPGVATASEIMLAQQDGLNELKFFPALDSQNINQAVQSKLNQ